MVSGCEGHCSQVLKDDEGGSTRDIMDMFRNRSYFVHLEHFLMVDEKIAPLIFIKKLHPLNHFEDGSLRDILISWEHFGAFGAFFES